MEATTSKPTAEAVRGNLPIKEALDIFDALERTGFKQTRAKASRGEEVVNEVSVKENLVPPAAQDFFQDLAALRIVPDGNESAVVRKVLNMVPVKKPAKEWFFRIHPEYAVEALILEVKEDNETLLVGPALHGALIDEKCVCRRILRLGINRQGNPFIWPVRLPMEGRRDGWAMTSLDAINRAETQWVRMQADMNLGGYKLAIAKIEEEPVWPELPFNELLRIAFNNAVVDSLEHPTLKRLRGEL